MGTSASIQIEDEEGEPLVGIHIHWDGDRIPTFVKKFSDGKPVVNGYNGEDMFNGMGDYAARLIANLKFKRYDGFEDYTKPGDIYVVPYAEAYGEYEVLVKYGGPNNPVIVQRQVDGEPFGKININNKKTNMKGAETFNAQNSDMDKKSLVEGEVSIKMNELFEFVNYHVDAEDGAGGDLYDSPGLDEIEEAVSDYFIGYWDFETRHNSNNPRYQNAETFNADSTPRFIPVEVIKYDAWFPRRYGREYNPTLIGNDYDDSYAVCVRDIPIAHFDTKEKAENHANTVRTAISVLGGVTPSTIDHPLALREMDGYADKNIRGGMNMAETFGAENERVCDYCEMEAKDMGMVTFPNGLAVCDMCFDEEAETFNAYKVAPELSSYTKDELISSKAGPQGSASYDEMVYDPIAQDRLSAESFASDEERRLKAFAKKIENEKKKLVKKAKRSGFYENFGQKEVRKLEDSISDLDYYEQQKYQEMIRDFDNWADSIDLRSLEHYAETFASETSSTLKSVGYVAGTIGVGYLIFQRFVKDRLDETMNQ